MPRLFATAAKPYEERFLYDACRAWHVAELALRLFLPLNLVQKMFRVHPGLRPRKVKASHLAGTPTPNHRGRVLIVPSQPGDQRQWRRDSPHERSDEFR